jgi:hypothetical protein
VPHAAIKKEPASAAKGGSGDFAEVKLFAGIETI